MSWTDERVAVLKKLWGEGKTAAEIAKTLGDVTRNAVIGKAHRMKLSGRMSPIQQNNKSKKTAANTPAKQAPRKPSIKAQPEFKGREVKMADLESNECRWPNGDPKMAEFSFCGCKTDIGETYCETHKQAAYQSATRIKAIKPEDIPESTSGPRDFDIKTASSS